MNSDLETTCALRTVPKRTLDQDRYRRLAERQGVTRPFDILVRMSADSRRLIADLLGCRMRAWEGPEAQAWRIINQDLRGLQARTHTLPEQLTPFSRNNNWWEIVTRTARRLGVQFYPGLKDEEVERLLFDKLAELYVQHHLAEDQDLLDSLAETVPEIDRAIRSLRLSRAGCRTVLAAVAQATVRGGASLKQGSLIVGDWIRTRFRWSWMVPISSGLTVVQQYLTEIYRTWVARGFFGRARGNVAKVCTAVALIHFQDLVDRTLDEFETIGG